MLRCTCGVRVMSTSQKAPLTIAGFRGDIRIAPDSGYERMELDADARLIPAWNGDGRANSATTLYCLRAPRRIGKNCAHTGTVEECDTSAISPGSKPDVVKASRNPSKLQISKNRKSVVVLHRCCPMTPLRAGRCESRSLVRTLPIPSSARIIGPAYQKG